MNIIKELKQPILLSFALFLLCGLAYPYALTGIGQVFMPEKAQGSLLRMGEKGDIIGSSLVGQSFTDPRFLKGRPSAVNYNTFDLAENGVALVKDVASGSANFAASNPALLERIAQDKEAFLAANPDAREIPADLLTASGSGLDPHISPAAASVQLPALVKNTGLPMEELEAMVARHTTKKMLGMFGGESVHVLKVNREIAQRLGMTAEMTAGKTEK